MARGRFVAVAAGVLTHASLHPRAERLRRLNSAAPNATLRHSFL